MSEFEKKSLEMELKVFASKNFERPTDCRNLDQIRFYIRELCMKIEEYQKHFNYVPGVAYALLAQYNAQQNTIIHKEFLRTY
ncbi:hypothetical protein [Pseudochryseolinea flava]|uniref:Uncharacterized protein n=1 Tax=Pseudochryseolinea flava TaxID=2059302 RepID=A0A364Y144_9BACT|nr:hypothetical protein [Pseudochryseolinea flava]RAW00321.1 hypothetical protein DQQ10_14810 [Pseudochryseolinea flava]